MINLKSDQENKKALRQNTSYYYMERKDMSLEANQYIYKDLYNYKYLDTTQKKEYISISPSHLIY